jgi:thioesterase domain-containing protein
MTTAQRLQQSLHELIPLSRAMRLEVALAEPERVVLVAPLAENRNHAGTAFAGSLYSLASLAGWALLRQLLLREALDADVVLAEGRMRYHRPCAHALRAEALLPLAAQQGLIRRLRAGRATPVPLTVSLAEAGPPWASFTGNYFLQPMQPPVSAE